MLFKKGQLFCIIKRGDCSGVKSGAGITKIGNFITKWGNCCKVGHYRRQMRETGEGNRFGKPTT